MCAWICADDLKENKKKNKNIKLANTVTKKKKMNRYWYGVWGLNTLSTQMQITEWNGAEVIYFAGYKCCQLYTNAKKVIDNLWTYGHDKPTMAFKISLKKKTFVCLLLPFPAIKKNMKL